QASPHESLFRRIRTRHGSRAPATRAVL
ncbi:uncharacterized protein METZ01_LOCUS444472, partial [marine metagenome]